MRGSFSTQISSFLPEASILLLLVGVGASVSGLGSHLKKIEAPIQGPAPAALFVPPLLPTPSWVSPSQVHLPSIATAQSPVVAPQRLVLDASRIEHARELLGKFYDRSVVKNGEKVPRVDRFVRHWTDRALSAKFKKYSKVIADTVLEESTQHGFDPVFLMAVIENESSFNPRAVGPVGEIGLMQVTPGTGEWISKKFGLKWGGKKSLRDPRTNIRIGAAYLAYLREAFDSHGQLYLAAYNMGSLNVNRALEKSIWPKDYPQRVMKRYIKFYGDLKATIKAEAGPKG